jgi:type IV secretory pathway VirB10-like protein
MNNKNNNPYLKQILSEISSNANKYRLNDLSWETIYEARKKKSVKKEQDEKKQDALAGEPAADETGGDLPPLGGADEKPKILVRLNKRQRQEQSQPIKRMLRLKQVPKKPQQMPVQMLVGDEAEQAKADATKAKAELEKAKAEKEQAEKELKKHKYVKIGSSGGTQFLLGKVLDHAFKSNTIDALAGELVDKLKVQTPEDMDAFSEDVVTYMTIPGMPELISA